MTTSSSPTLERALDSMLIVYSLLQNHPASVACEQFLRQHTGWFTSVLALFEAKMVMTKVYGADPGLTSQKLAKLANSPLVLLELSSSAALYALALSDAHNLDLTDAVLLHHVNENAVTTLATEDQRLVKTCKSLSIKVESPFDNALRQKVAAWESTHLPPKGLARVLHRVHQWLRQHHKVAAQDFWSHTGGASHLP